MKRKIQLLPDNIINKIAAGEVVERPSSVVKELVENSIDAKSTKIEIFIRSGGKAEITVADNGEGISSLELDMSVRRHATSKLKDSNLANINTLGFRGEALSSISSVSDFFLSSNNNTSSNGYIINITGGEFKYKKPVNQNKGTTVKVKNLFFNVPARLKFLKSENYEALLIKRLIQKLSLSFVDIEFNLVIDEKKIFFSPITHKLEWFDKLELRTIPVLGNDFIKNSVKINKIEEKFSFKGLLGIPTFNFSNSNNIFFFVNNRIIFDKSITTIFKVAYRDFISHDKFPQLILFLDCKESEVDINVHPMKYEVRFKDINYLKSSIIKIFRDELSNIGHKASSFNSQKAIENFITEDNKQATIELKEKGSEDESNSKDFPPVSEVSYRKENNDFPLGYAKTQLHETYIVSENKKGILLIDQHAAHERLVYEKLKDEFYNKKIETQILLIPAVIDFDNLLVKNMEECLKNAENYGVKLEVFGKKSLIVREVPVILANCNIKELVLDLMDELVDNTNTDTVEEKINKICSSMACHGSIRAGRSMEVDEMNDLLRRMEKTVFSGQCNHGRPTYVELRLEDIEKLFGRK